MLTRIYLRASTKEQDATRAKKALERFADEHGLTVVGTYIENESGATLERPELMRLLSDARDGDVLLVEQVDRLARLNNEDWERLKILLSKKRIQVVSPELPISWESLKGGDNGFSGAMLGAINKMMLDMLAAIARKDYEDRRRRQMEGIQRAQALGKYKGGKRNEEKRKAVAAMLKSGHSYQEIRESLRCGYGMVASVRKEMEEAGAL